MIVRSVLAGILALVFSSCASSQPILESLCHNARLISTAAQVLCALSDSSVVQTPEIKARADSLKARIDSLEQVIIRQVHQ